MQQGGKFRSPHRVFGHNLEFRLASPDDAEFILGLRLDEAKSRFLSAVDSDVQAQRKWLASCLNDPNQLYLIILNREEEPVGTVRLYDPRGNSFGWGSWILTDSAPKSAAVESTLMVYELGLACGFTAAHFDVRKGNEKVWQYHERFGARRIREDDINYYYEIGELEIRAALDRYGSRLPEAVRIEFED